MRRRRDVIKIFVIVITMTNNYKLIQCSIQLIFIFFKISFLTLLHLLCDFLGFSFSLCEKTLRARGKRSALLNSAYQKTIRTLKKVKKN